MILPAFSCLDVATIYSAKLPIIADFIHLMPPSGSGPCGFRHVAEI